MELQSLGTLLDAWPEHLVSADGMAIRARESGSSARCLVSRQRLPEHEGLVHLQHRVTVGDYAQRYERLGLL